ncbi:MAG: nucleotide sugar dehydrogenase [Chloroflexota bacterium]
MAISIELLQEKIAAGNLTVGVIGLGYVGLPLASEFAGKGFRTFGFDVDSNKIQSLERGVNYIEDIDSEQVRQIVEQGKLIPTWDFSRCAECDAIFICVPTPFTPNKDPDITFIEQAARDVRDNLRPGQVVVLKSTTFPGTTEKYVKPILEESGLIAGKDFYLAFSPERIDPGNKKWNTANTPIVVGGIDELSSKLAAFVHGLVVSQVIEVSSPAIAEMEKLLENIFRGVNIALVNELAQLCDRIGVNIWEVVDAASTKPFGYMPFYPGPGIGGHCILIDPYYLAWMAREYDFVTNFITLAGEINEEMPFYVRGMVIKEIAKQPITMADAKILMLGMAFKRDVDDLRHSPALKVAELLKEDSIGHVSYFDPYIPSIRICDESLYSEKELTADMLKNYDVVVITTDHTIFDFEMIASNAKVVIDTRNALKHIKKDRSNIVLLGEGKGK